MKNFFRAIFLLALVLPVFGCAALGTYNPATGHRELIFISTESEVEMGRSIHRQITTKEKLSADQAAQQRVERIGQRLARISDRQDYQYHFFVVNKNELNAFTVPGGSVYIYSGLLDKLTDDDELAAVLAHEIGHCAARHSVKKFQAALGYDLVGSLILSQVNTTDQVKQVAGMSADALMSIVFSSYSRKDEYEADTLGVKYMDLAGFDLAGMVRAFEILERSASGKGPPLILRSHPYISDRIQKVKEEISRIKSGS